MQSADEIADEPELDPQQDPTDSALGLASTRSTRPFERPPTPNHGRPSILGPMIGVLLLWMTVDVIPAVSNDALHYLDNSMSIRAAGLVEEGYMLLGYPVFLRAVTWLGGLAGLDPLFSIVLVQRLGALFFGLLVARFYRWWGVALYGVLFSIGTTTYVNYVLTEGVALPLAALAGVAFATVWTGHARLWRAGIWLVVAAIFLSLLRPQLAVVWVAPALIVLMLWWKDRPTAIRFGAISAIGVLLVAGVYVGVVQENGDEYGTESLIVRTGSLEYLSAWTTVFEVEAVAPETAELAALYGEGSPWPRWREMAVIEPISASNAAYEKEVSALLEASNLSLAELRLRAFAGAILAGRTDDMSGIKQRVVADDLSVRLSSTYGSARVKSMGPELFLEIYNEGEEPGVLVVSSLVRWVPVLPRWTVGALWLTLLAIALIPGSAVRWQYGFVLVAALPTFWSVGLPLGCLGITIVGCCPPSRSRRRPFSLHQWRDSSRTNRGFPTNRPSHR